MENFTSPYFEPRFAFKGQNKYIFDNFRKKFVVFTPEEWVRQCTAHFLVQKIGVPKGLIRIELSLKVGNSNRRADIVVYNKILQPHLVVECKAAHIPLSHSTLWQIAQYNLFFKSKYTLITNGVENYIFLNDVENYKSEVLDEIPDFFNW